MYNQIYFKQPTSTEPRSPLTESETEKARTTIRQTLVAGIERVIRERE